MPVPSFPLRVLFLLQRAEAWSNVASIWREMLVDPAFTPVVWLLPCNAEDAELSVRRLPQHRTLLTSEGVDFVEWNATLRLRENQFDVVVFTHPYDRERPRALWVDQVRRRVARIVYVPYGLSVGAGPKNLRLQFAQQLQCKADIVIARSVEERAMYARHCPAGDAHVHVLGHPRFDRLMHRLNTIDVQELQARICGRMVFLWSSHFSFGHRYSQSSNFSTFDLIAPEMFDYFSRRKDRLCLLWRPHPALLPALLDQGLLQKEQLPVLQAELDSLGIVLDTQADHLPAFACSHALMSDPGSFLFEYLATGRPLLPLLNPEGEPLNDEAAALVADCGSASCFSDVRGFIDDVVAGRVDSARYKLLQARHLPLLDGQSGARVVALLAGRNLPSGEVMVAAARRPLPVAAAVVDDGVYAPMPPTLLALLAGLNRIRDEKAAESVWCKRRRRVFNRFRTTLGEAIKQRPWLMEMISRVRR